MLDVDKIKRDIPIFEKSRLIYLDSCATTLKRYVLMMKNIIVNMALIFIGVYELAVRPKNMIKLAIKLRAL